MREIIIVQHCQSEHHINNMSGGWTNTPLTDFGRKQAYLLGIRLKKMINSTDYGLISSDLLRAKQTAEIIGGHLDIIAVEDVRLREINTGVAAGKTKDWAKQNRNPKLTEGFDIDYREFEEGESWREFFVRVSDVMETIIRLKNKHIIIVTHGCTLSYIVAWWMGFDVKSLERAYFPAKPGSISILSENSYRQNSLILFNDTSHLQGLVYSG